ncbi:MAG: DUF4430 domain-containing protein [Candidatus Izimaplasma sp.]|nr:DUF4430 domain-containing protein [Candidatus Izimaplasma bacterium]
MKKLVYSIIVIALTTASFIVYSQLNNNNDAIGEITITVIDEIGDTVSSKTYSFAENDTLFSILEDNYDLGCADSSYQLTTVCEPLMLSSRVILKIDSVETDWNNTFIAIYENDEYSNFGLDSISLNDGDIFRFEYSEVGGE